MKYLLIISLLLTSCCTSVTSPEGQHRLGAIIATVYKIKEHSMPLEYRVAAKVAYRVLSLATAGEQNNDLAALNVMIDRYAETHQLPEEHTALAKLTLGQVYARAKLGALSPKIRLERLRYIKSGIDSVVN